MSNYIHVDDYNHKNANTGNVSYKFAINPATIRVGNGLNFAIPSTLLRVCPVVRMEDKLFLRRGYKPQDIIEVQKRHGDYAGAERNQSRLEGIYERT